MNQKKQQLRIIAGIYRGRKLAFPDAAGLRPTTDRIRETLFNWLQKDIRDARCLDLFTGSGALGLEALSRGAAEVVLVDNNPAVKRSLLTVIEQWHTPKVTVSCCDALTYLTQEHPPFDIVFLDPPFHHDILGHCLTALSNSRCIHPQSLIYIESGAQITLMPEKWQVIRQKTSGNVCYGLYRQKEDGLA